MSINNPDILCQKVYDLAKYHYNRSVFCKFLVYVVGVIGIFVTDTYSVVPVVALLLIVLSEFLQYRSDTYKGIAESLRRKLDFMHSFGWSIPKKDLTDVLLELPQHIEEKVKATPAEDYFMSSTDFGPVKALENLEESAWWSKHLTKIAWKYCVGIIAFVLLLSFVSLYISINLSVKNLYIPQISKIITSSIMVLFSIGFVRTAIGYSRFRKKAGQIDSILPDKIKSTTLGDPECIKLWSEYHIARASSPLIPSIIWEMNEKRLNTLKKTH